MLVLTGCTRYFNSSQDEGRQTTFVIDELRMELADLKHTLKATQVEFSLLEEKVKSTDKSDNKLKEINAHLALLEKKITQLSQVQDKTLSDLRQLSSHANQSSAAFNQFQQKLSDYEHEIQGQNRKLDEVNKLKGTLTSISKAMSPKPAQKTHKVKAGETLEKIARLYNVKSQTLKKLNGFESDRIAIGQEIQIPSDE
jgi:LysM repeat protein